MSTQDDGLEPIEPRDALELFIGKRRSNNRAPSTISSNRSHLGTFVDWLESEGITNLNELSGREVFRCRQKRGRKCLCGSDEFTCNGPSVLRPNPPLLLPQRVLRVLDPVPYSS